MDVVTKDEGCICIWMSTLVYDLVIFQRPIIVQPMKNSNLLR